MGGHNSSNEVHKSHKKEYFIIFFALAVLTVIEVYVAEMQTIAKLAKNTAITGLAIGKAFLVAYFYMHLKEETKWLKFIAAVPISAVIFTVVVVCESLYR